MSDIERMLPLYEGKMIHHFDHRWATFENDGSTRDVTLEEKQDPHFSPLPRYWVRESVVEEKLAGGERFEELLGFRDICRSTDERTVIASLFPRSAVGNNLPVAFTSAQNRILAAVLTSFALDYTARLKVGGTHLNFYIAEQLPVPHPELFLRPAPWDSDVFLSTWIDCRVTELQRAPWKSLNARPILRAELDAAFFHLYGLEREDVDYIMDTFPIVQRNDEAAHGEFRTKRLILEAYDAMAVAMRTQTPFVSTLDPPPESFLDEPVE